MKSGPIPENTNRVKRENLVQKDAEKINSNYKLVYSVALISCIILGLCTIFMSMMGDLEWRFLIGFVFALVFVIIFRPRRK